MTQRIVSVMSGFILKRTERLFAIAEVLKARRTGITADELAERFSVSVRTIYRDLDTLRMASLPVRADQGRGGGYALESRYSLPPVNFTSREAAVLVAAVELMGRMRWLPFRSTLETAIDKVRGALPRGQQAELDRLRANLSFVGVPARTASAQVLEAIEDAWFRDAPLQIEYRGADGGVSRRNVRIRNVVMERTHVLLNCEDLGLGQPRQFRLHQIESAQPD